MGHFQHLVQIQVMDLFPVVTYKANNHVINQLRYVVGWYSRALTLSECSWEACTHQTPFELKAPLLQKSRFSSCKPATATSVNHVCLLSPCGRCVNIKLRKMSSMFKQLGSCCQPNPTLCFVLLYNFLQWTTAFIHTHTHTHIVD